MGRCDSLYYRNRWKDNFNLYTTMSEPVKKALMEFLRIVLLAAIPVALVFVADLPPEWAAVLTLLLKALDKYLHEKGKETKNDSLTLGLTRF